MEARIRQLQATLKTAVVVDAERRRRRRPSAPARSSTIRYEGDDDTERFFVGSIEERHEGLDVVSPGSPLGRPDRSRAGDTSSTRPRREAARRDRRGATDSDRARPGRSHDSGPQTLVEKVWDRHVVRVGRRASPTCSSSTCTSSTRSPRRRPSTACAWPGGASGAPTSPSRRPTTTSRPTESTRRRPIPISRQAARGARRNCAEFGITCYPMGHANQGIVHVIGPEQGLTQPGMTIVCGDSHTSTHGAFGALAFGIGTSEVEHVLATQTLPQARPKTMAVEVEGELPPGVTAKDLVLGDHRRASGPAAASATSSSTAGAAIRGALDGGAHDRLQHVDRGRRPRRAWSRPTTTTFAYLEGRRHAPSGDALGGGGRGLADARRPTTDAEFDSRSSTRRRASCARTSPGGPTRRRWCRSTARCPIPTSFDDAAEREAAARALALHGPRAPARRCGTSRSTPSSSARARTRASRTCGAAAAVLDGRQVRTGVRALVVPGSRRVKDQAEAEGLDRVFVGGRLRVARAGLLDVPRP